MNSLMSEGEEMAATMNELLKEIVEEVEEAHRDGQLALASNKVYTEEDLQKLNKLINEGLFPKVDVEIPAEVSDKDARVIREKAAEFGLNVLPKSEGLEN